MVDAQMIDVWTHEDVGGAVAAKVVVASVVFEVPGELWLMHQLLTMMLYLRSDTVVVVSDVVVVSVVLLCVRQSCG